MWLSQDRGHPGDLLAVLGAGSCTHVHTHLAARGSAGEGDQVGHLHQQAAQHGAVCFPVQPGGSLQIVERTPAEPSQRTKHTAPANLLVQYKSPLAQVVFIVLLCLLAGVSYGPLIAQMPLCHSGNSVCH